MMSYSGDSAVGVIGAGPYGLSIAAHLRFREAEFRIFGAPMQHWRANMPKGMFLKSEGSASSLFDPAGTYTLARYCANQGLNYAPWGTPVPLETFTQYGLSFQESLVPTVENAIVEALDRSSSGFELHLSTGEKLRVRKVVVASGMSHTAYIPATLRGLPQEVLSHSSGHHDLSGFKNLDITVIGGGQSAIETAALLQEAGAQVCLLVRRPSLAWNNTPIDGHRTVYARLRRPMSALGAGLGPWLYSNAPMLFGYLPRQIRFERVRKTLGPAGAWWLKERVIDRVPTVLGHSTVGARTSRDRVILSVKGPDGQVKEMTTDHVIAATGYRFNIGTLPFLSQRLSSEVRCVSQMPVLSSGFESSVSGLYFTGLASVLQFGPAMRFLHGAGYTARRVVGHIERGKHRLSVPLSVLPSSRVGS